ncbi:MAG: hypothetical protein DCC67_10305 [Planctomycetota bacterium]|nr:MAG: hypothetical protein DCC67_10305 [Planctomycetota bacterium]
MKLTGLRQIARLRGVLRWRYVAPRAAIVVAVVLVVRFGLDPLLRWAIVTTGQAALGAKVELGELRTSLKGGELVVTNLAAANPQKPLRNLIEADEFRFQFDVKQLFRKRLVIRDGGISGLSFDSPRTTSGALPDAPTDQASPSPLEPVVAVAEEKALAWFDDLAGRMQHDLLGSLATPRLVDELETRWPQQYDALKARAEGLRHKSKQIEAAFREAKKNPLRNLAQIDQLRKELAAAEAELRTAVAEIQALPSQAKADRLAVDAARKQDEQFLREQLKFGNVDAEELNRYLLGEAAHGYLTQTAYWIEQAQKFIPKKKIAPPARARGTNVLFMARKQPACLIERVRLDGHARFDGQPLAFTGELTDAASEPELHDRPLRLRLAGSGALDATIVAILDRRGDIPHDWVRIDVPKLMLSDRTLGNASKLAVTVSPGEASLQADVRVDGESISGVISLRQSSKLAAATPMLRDDRIAQVLHESLAGVDRLEATVHLSGALKRPSVRIESNVGPQLAGGVKGAVAKYLADRQERLLAKVQDKAVQQLAKLEAKRREAEKELLAKLGQDQKLISQIAALLQGQLPVTTGGLPQVSMPPVSVPQLGKLIPKDKLTR